MVDIKGHIDACTNGLLQGWVQTADTSQQIQVRIDGADVLSVVADRYRADLEMEAVLDGHASFNEPLLPIYLDDQIHRVEVYDQNQGALMASAEILFEKTEKLRKLDESVLSCFGTTELPAKGRIAILCGYEKQTRLSLSTTQQINLLKQKGFFVAFVLAVDKHLGRKVLADCPADLIIVRKNIGYDFGSWACGLYKLRQLGLLDCQDLLLVNDSILWTGKDLEEHYLSLTHGGVDYDVVGAVESYEATRHLQSFFILFSSRVIRQCHLDHFLLYSGPLSSKKDEIIVNFELRSASFFEEHGLKTHVINSYQMLAAEYLDKCERHVPKTYNIDPGETSLSFDERLMAGWYHHIHVGKTCNPTHVFWDLVLQKGFPFLKKELLFKNPANIAYYERFQDELEKAAIDAVQDHLRHAAHPLIPIIEPRRRPFIRKLEKITPP